MKKILLCTLILTVALTLSGCSNKNSTNTIDSEFDRLSNMIPDEFESNFVLPNASESFSLEYYLDDTIITDYIVEYTPLPQNKNIILKLIISSGDDEDIFYMSIINLGNEQLYNQSLIDNHFHEIFTQIAQHIPSYMISNTSLPINNYEMTTIEYNTNCTNITRNRIEYSFPEETEQCSINVKVTYDGEVREQDYLFMMSAVSDLPKIPALYITTVNNQAITTKEEYVQGTLTLVIEGESNFSQIENAEMGIKLRGNSTLVLPKKPYKIKFEDKQSLLSDYAEKKWVLLANHVDQTLLRDYLAFSMAGKLDMRTSPSYTFVDVYINGEYQGNYLLTDQVEVSENRVDIEEKVSDINTGYLVEYDIGLYREGLENTDENYFLIDEIPFVIKSPDFEDDHYVIEQKEYIEEYFNTVLSTLKNKEDYSSLINESTFIDWFIVNEVFKNVDSGYSSIYFNKDKDGLLEMGPVWDFDISSGVPGYVSVEDRGPIGWWTARSDKNVFLHYLMEYPSFRENLQDRWNEIYEDVIEVVLDEIFYASDLITQSRYNNFELWDIIGKEVDWYTSPEVYDLKTYDEQVWFLYDYLKTRIEWINEELN